MEVAFDIQDVHDKKEHVSYYSAQFIKEGSAGQLLCSYSNSIISLQVIKITMVVCCSESKLLLPWCVVQLSACKERITKL